MYKKLLTISLFLALFVFSGCSTKNNDTIKTSDRALDDIVNTVDTKRLEAHDQYLISKTKEIEILTQLYAGDNEKYPATLNQDGVTTVTKIYKGSADWIKLRDLLLKSKSNEGITTDINETVTAGQPIEYSSDGNTYTFKVYLNYDKDYTVNDNNFKCQTKQDKYCILTINSEQ